MRYAKLLLSNLAGQTFNMHNELVTKRSPIVLMWKFAAIEAAGLILYFVASFLGDAKYEIYSQLFLTNILPYMTARVIFLFFAQFVMTVYAFLSWYTEEYKIRANSIIHVKGFFKKRSTSFGKNKSAQVIIKSSVLGKLLHYGTIQIRSNGAYFYLKQISHPERMLNAIEEGPLAVAFAAGPDVRDLLQGEEGGELEFKSSLRFDYKLGNVNRELEKAAMKTVAAFLNSNGGHLVLGVSDKHEPLGLQNDYSGLQRKDRDGFENHFTQSFNASIGPEFRNFVKLWFYPAGVHEICVIQTLPSPRPVYFKADGNEYFFMRTGNITSTLKLSEIESYLRSRWPKR
mgnify:FL=1